MAETGPGPAHELTSADRQAVEDLLSAYVLALDVDDVEGAMALFAPGGEFHTYGRIFVGDRLRHMFESAPKGQHLTGRSLVTCSLTGASVRSQLLFLPADRSAHRMTIYDDEVENVRGRWLFRRRTCRFMDGEGRLQDRP
jgi:hypothetical protein